MSRPHFLADNDLNDAIVMGVLRREPTIEFARLRDLGLATRADPEVLDHAAREKWIVSSSGDTIPNFSELGMVSPELCLNRTAFDLAVYAS